jgi:hypothetical protein
LPAISTVQLFPLPGHAFSVMKGTVSVTAA